jgi:hypothetical protein
VAAGTLTLSGTVDQVFNNHLTGGSWTVAGAAARAELTISSAAFKTIDPGVVVVVNGPYASFDNLSILTTNDGNLTLLGGAAVTTNGNFTNAGILTLTPSATLNSELIVNGGFAQASLGTLKVGLGGTSSAPTFGVIACSGTAALAGQLKVSSTVVPPVGSLFDLLQNGSGSAISGAFLGLAEGATFTVKVGSTTMTFKISYQGGSSGQDLILTRVT